MSDLPLEPGERLRGRYVIERIHRMGGLSTLYETIDLQSTRLYSRRAVKESLLDISDGWSVETLSGLFNHRAKLLLGFNHPIIVPTVDFFVIGQRAYLVMDFVNGVDLEDVLLNQQKLRVDDVLEWGAHLCSALHYLHTHPKGPIIFRDMKPGNIIIRASGKPCLVDFGISIVYKKGQFTAPLGTDGYAAPEQYGGGVTPLSDLYGLGATLHHTLTRHDPRLFPPFTFEKRPIRVANPSVTREQEAVIMKALAYDEEERFQSAADMLQALNKVIHKPVPVKDASSDDR
ncbi:MAG: serine/threonine protein kinase [Chloroflexi bacterium]|nr:serine/threonine protein kinase [Chloroflexota bacterium]